MLTQRQKYRSDNYFNGIMFFSRALFDAFKSSLTCVYVFCVYADATHLFVTSNFVRS